MQTYLYTKKRQDGTVGVMGVKKHVWGVVGIGTAGVLFFIRVSGRSNVHNETGPKVPSIIGTLLYSRQRSCHHSTYILVKTWIYTMPINFDIPKALEVPHPLRDKF